MGFLKGAKFPYGTDGKKEAQFVVAWGSLIRDPKIFTWNQKVKATCTIKTYTKSYLNLVVWGDNELSRIIATLEEKDVIVAIGTELTYEYTTKNGVKKVAHELNVEYLLPPQSLSEFLLNMAGNKGINALMDETEVSDAFESDDEFEPDDEFFREAMGQDRQSDNEADSGEWETDVDENEMPFK